SVTEAATIAVAETAAPALIALAIPIDLAHHHRGAFLELLDPHREVAQHIFIEPLLPLDLVDHGRRRVEVHEGVVRLAVLAQPVGERLDAPLLELGDLAAHLLDDALEMGGQLLDLLRARVLAREEDVLIEGHGMPFPLLCPPRRVALRTLSGKARMLRRRKHRTPGHAALPRALSKIERPCSRPFSSRPGSSGRLSLIGCFGQKARIHRALTPAAVLDL